MEKHKKGFTFKEHQRIGKQILQLRQKIRTLHQKTLNAYGKPSKAARLAERMLRDLGLLQKELNAILCRENPDSSKLEILACYYPDRNA